MEDIGVTVAIGMAAIALLGNGFMWFLKRTLDEHDAHFKSHCDDLERHNERIQATERNLATLTEQSKNNGERGARIEGKLDNLITRMVKT